MNGLGPINDTTKDTLELAYTKNKLAKARVNDTKIFKLLKTTAEYTHDIHTHLTLGTRSDSQRLKQRKDMFAKTDRDSEIQRKGQSDAAAMRKHLMVNSPTTYAALLQPKKKPSTPTAVASTSTTSLSNEAAIIEVPARQQPTNSVTNADHDKTTMHHATHDDLPKQPTATVRS